MKRKKQIRKWADKTQKQIDEIQAGLNKVYAYCEKEEKGKKK